MTTVGMTARARWATRGGDGKLCFATLQVIEEAAGVEVPARST